MPAKWLAALLSIVPLLLYASQEEDMELFEFLALYDQKDAVFIDAEMDERSEINEVNNQQAVTSQHVTKSEADE